MATPHDERIKEFNRLIDAAARMLKVRRAAQEAIKTEEETPPEEEVKGVRKA